MSQSRAMPTRASQSLQDVCIMQTRIFLFLDGNYYGSIMTKCSVRSSLGPVKQSHGLRLASFPPCESSVGLGMCTKPKTPRCRVVDVCKMYTHMSQRP